MIRSVAILTAAVQGSSGPESPASSRTSCVGKCVSLDLTHPFTRETAVTVLPRIPVRKQSFEAGLTASWFSLKGFKNMPADVSRASLFSNISEALNKVT